MIRNDGTDTHLDDQFDQYMFILRILLFEMTALFSCTSNTMLDINRPYIGGKICNHSTVVQFTANTEILHTILMTNLINICSF